MGINRRDFFRILPTAIGKSDHAIDGSQIKISPIGGVGTLNISLGPEGERRLSALMVLPRMRVDFDFVEVSDEEAQAFMANFDFYYRRGGG
ncbi:MAG: hypothetical protein AAF434_08550 [Pseudomonadota bacterium]